MSDKRTRALFSDERSRSRREIALHSDGFTLVELLVVLSIIALLAALVTPRVLTYLSRARTNSAQMQIRNIRTALELYYIDNGAYPDEKQGLKALERAPDTAKGWSGPYLKNAGELADPWGRQFLYSQTPDGADVQVRSLGRDGIEGGDGEDGDLE